jgi:hypothetical protein
VLATCDYLSYLNAACIRKDRRFWPVVEARVQVELHDILLGWIEASERSAGRPGHRGLRGELVHLRCRVGPEPR